MFSWNRVETENIYIEIYLGFTKSEAGFLVTVSAAVDLVGRLGFGYLSDLEIFDRKKAYVIW